MFKPREAQKDQIILVGYFLCFVIFAAIVCLWITAGNGMRYLKLSHSGIQVSSLVSEAVTKRSSEQDIDINEGQTRYVFKYTDPADFSRSNTIILPTKWQDGEWVPLYEIGDKVPVVIDSSNPDLFLPIWLHERLWGDTKLMLFSVLAIVVSFWLLIGRIRAYIKHQREAKRY